MKRLKKPKAFTISRRWWQRDKRKPGDTLLRNHQGYQCCLGFYARACGCTTNEIRGCADPLDLVWHDGLKLPGMITAGSCNSTICGDLMECNDDAEITDKDRESKITKLFRKLGVKVSFVR